MTSEKNGPPLHTRLLQKLNGDVRTDSSNRSIFKVPAHLRRIREQAYEPQVISIGPYHHGKDQLKPMEVHKMHNLKMLLNRRKESSLERYVTALKSMEKEARNFYLEPLNHIGGEKFVEMMLLDGCFIIELIRKNAMEGQRDENDQPLTRLILSRAMLDLLLVENQLPFFILSELFNMTVMPNDEGKDFVGMAINFLSIGMPLPLPRPGLPLPRSQISRPKNQEGIKHLLGLVHDCWNISPDYRGVRIPHSQGDPESLEEVRIPLLKAMAIPDSSLSKLSEEDSISMPAASEKDALPSESKEAALSTATERDNERALNRNGTEWRFIRSATELSKAGIIFQKINERLFDIKFEKGVMSIPTLTVDDGTESILRNLVAYEQCFKGASSKLFTDYIIFMDCLMNTGEDVELLSNHGVIDSCLGCHEVVATIFNKIGDSVLISKDKFSYDDLFIEVEKYCNRKWNQWKANLLRKYFNTPWAGMAVFAAVLGLLLSVLNSVFTVLSYISN